MSLKFSFLKFTGKILTSPYSTSICSPLYSPRSLLRFLEISIDLQSLKLTQKSHAQILTHGLDQNPFLAAKLISAYAVVKIPANSLLVFHSISHKDSHIWNSILNGYVKNEAYNEAFDLFNEMQRCNVLPDDYTFAAMAKVSGEIGDLGFAKSIHGKSIRAGFVLDTVVANSLMSMYSKRGKCRDACKVFDEMPERSSASWNVLLASSGCDIDIWNVIELMESDGIKPDAFTVSSLLSLCNDDKVGLNYGKELHCYIIKNGLGFNFGSNVHMGCGLIDMYSRGNKVIISRRVFDQMRSRNIYTWTAMIGGYVENGDFLEALILFREMQMRDGIEPNIVSLVSVLPACNSHAGLIQGKQIHAFTLRKELNDNSSLCNALIDMYSKCGSLDYARLVFEDDQSFLRDAISWTTIVAGYGLHGRGLEAIDLYNKMLELKIKPDMITIVGILSACGRSGLVNEGLEIYNKVINIYKIEPTVEICASVVDMLGRSGQLNQALEFIEAMPVKPGPSVWGALVTASMMHGNSEIQELAYKFLIEVEPDNSSNLVSLSNSYASSSKWDVVAEVRKVMKARGLRKLPGCSWIGVNKNTHCFYVADKAHPCSELIHEVLDKLVLIMKGPKYFPEIEMLFIYN